MKETTSPFVTATEDSDWVVWESQASVVELHKEKQTDGRYDMESEEDSTLVPVQKASQIPRIQRMQYNAVLNRMNQATQKTGSFSAWA